MPGPEVRCGSRGLESRGCSAPHNAAAFAMAAVFLKAGGKSASGVLARNHPSGHTMFCRVYVLI